MSSNGRLRAGAPDFTVTFDDGSTFTSDQGTWDDVPKDRGMIARLDVAGATALSGFDAYAFAWEAIATMPIGLSTREKRKHYRGTIIALRANATTREIVRRVRVTATDLTIDDQAKAPVPA